MPELRRLVVRAPNWLGDAVLSLGALRDVRRNFPEARLEVLARPSLAELYGAVAEVDGVREAAGFRAEVASLRGAFDAALVFPNSFGSALAAWTAGVPERWGYATDARAGLLTRRPRVPRAVRGESQVYYYRAMLAGCGLSVSALPDVTLRCPDAWRALGLERLGGDARWLGLNPGAFYGAAKRWLPERFAAVAEIVHRHRGVKVAIVGGAAERPLADAVAAAMRVPARNLCGETRLPELLGVLSALSLLITNDSGPMHLAAALGVPLLAIFGPTDWRETAPFAERARLVREPVYCAPCKLRECPVDHACMRRVTVERVAAEALALLDGSA
jgi:heptosyltransferase-2